MIPPFDSRGLLPPSPHGEGYQCTMEEIRQRLVLDLGSPVWRVELFAGLEKLTGMVWSMVPSAWWWLWGCFVSNHAEPLFGDLEVITALVVLPVADLPVRREHGEMLLHYIQGAEQTCRVDCAFVFEFPEGHERRLETVDALEMKYRDRATSGVADHGSMELVPAGFLEVRA
jgi:hypothetical protein